MEPSPSLAELKSAEGNTYTGLALGELRNSILEKGMPGIPKFRASFVLRAKSGHRDLLLLKDSNTGGVCSEGCGCVRSLSHPAGVPGAFTPPEVFQLCARCTWSPDGREAPEGFAEIREERIWLGDIGQTD